MTQLYHSWLSTQRTLSLHTPEILVQCLLLHNIEKNGTNLDLHQQKNDKASMVQIHDGILFCHKEK